MILLQPVNMQLADISILHQKSLVPIRDQSTLGNSDKSGQNFFGHLYIALFVDRTMQTQFTNTTLCYIRSNDQTLMLRRAKRDSMYGKWIVPGGKFEPGETPEECAIRESLEETGLTLNKVDLRGILTFVNDRTSPRIKTTTCFVFECFDFHGALQASDEGELRWVADSEMTSLDIPRSDQTFIPWIYNDRRTFSAKFRAGLQSVVFF
ncbi:MAG: 8-oxo-dGTP diphosphatase [Chloroflexota bacterium]